MIGTKIITFLILKENTKIHLKHFLLQDLNCQLDKTIFTS